jgi:hypothetical protein
MSKVSFDLRNFEFIKLPDEINSIIFSYISIPRTINEFNKMMENVSDNDWIQNLQKIDCRCMLNSNNGYDFTELLNNRLLKINAFYNNKIKQLRLKLGRPEYEEGISFTEMIALWNQHTVFLNQANTEFLKISKECKYVLLRFKYRLKYTPHTSFTNIVKICNSLV